MASPKIRELREFLKDSIRLAVDWEGTEQARGVPMPLAERPAPEGAARVPLAEPGSWKGIRSVDLETAIRVRKSHRKFTGAPLSLDELAFLLWATQGVSRRAGDRSYRTVPSAGCRHAFETVVAALRVEGLEPGLWRYLPFSHALVREGAPERLAERLTEATLGQSFCGAAAATFCWTCVPRRMEWRYDRAAHRVIAMDAGHVAQNLYLACSAVGCGTCAVAAYDQKAMDAFLAVDGDEEFTLYLAPVGKL